LGLDEAATSVHTSIQNLSAIWYSLGSSRKFSKKFLTTCFYPSDKGDALPDLNINSPAVSTPPDWKGFACLSNTARSSVFDEAVGFQKCVSPYVSFVTFETDFQYPKQIVSLSGGRWISTSPGF